MNDENKELIDRVLKRLEDHKDEFNFKIEIVNPEAIPIAVDRIAKLAVDLSERVKGDN